MMSYILIMDLQMESGMMESRKIRIKRTRAGFYESVN